MKNPIIKNKSMVNRLWNFMCYVMNESFNGYREHVLCNHLDYSCFFSNTLSLINGFCYWNQTEKGGFRFVVHFSLYFLFFLLEISMKSENLGQCIFIILCTLCRRLFIVQCTGLCMDRLHLSICRRQCTTVTNYQM